VTIGGGLATTCHPCSESVWEVLGDAAGVSTLTRDSSAERGEVSSGTSGGATGGVKIGVGVADTCVTPVLSLWGSFWGTLLACPLPLVILPLNERKFHPEHLEAVLGGDNWSVS
jgi:hypothetical protein